MMTLSIECHFLGIVLLSAILLSVILLSVVMLSVVAPILEGTL